MWNAGLAAASHDVILASLASMCACSLCLP